MKGGVGDTLVCVSSRDVAVVCSGGVLLRSTHSTEFSTDKSTDRSFVGAPAAVIPLPSSTDGGAGGGEGVGEGGVAELLVVFQSSAICSLR